MTTKTILMDKHIKTLALSMSDHELMQVVPFARAIEQAVLQSPEVQALRNAHDVLIRNGFVQCDISACNCGSWHARHGYPERMREIKDALSESGHPLSNDNGNLAINALNDLISESQALRKDAETERAIQRAADVLPRDWQITVEVEQGSGYVSLYFQGDEIEFGDPSDGIADSIKAAISAAMEQQA